MDAADTERSYLGRYQVLESLGAGGMGEVFLAVLHGAGSFERRVAIKRVLPHLSADEEAVRAFLAEAALTARITHPNVCQVHSIEVIDGEYFMVMEYLDGVPLLEIIKAASRAKQAIPVGVACEIIRQACEGLHAAHELRDGERELNLVHRDVSPSNFMVTTAGVVKVLDFGIAKTHDSSMTEAGALKGKIPYMSPEQVRSQPLDRRSDVFALGTCLYELLTLRSPFRKNSPYDSASAIITCAPPPVDRLRPGLPRRLSAVLARAMAPARAARYDDAAEMAAALEQVKSESDLRCSAAELAAFVRDASRSGGEEVESRPSGETALGKARGGAPSDTLGTEKLVDLARAQDDAGAAPWATPSHGLGPESGAEVSSRGNAPHGDEEVLTDEDKRKTNPMRRTDSGVVTKKRLPSEPQPSRDASFESTHQGFHSVQTPSPYGGTSAGPAMQFPPSGIQPLQGTLHGTGPMYVIPHPTANRALWAAVALVAVAGVLVLIAARSFQQSSRPAEATAVRAPEPAVPQSPPSVSEVMESRHGDFLSCFERYTEDTVGAPEVQLVVEVRRTGAVEAVRVLPALVEESTLGTCLSEVANRLHFPTIRTKTSFQVPLRVTSNP